MWINGCLRGKSPFWTDYIKVGQSALIVNIWSQRMLNNIRFKSVNIQSKLAWNVFIISLLWWQLSSIKTLQLWWRSGWWRWLYLEWSDTTTPYHYNSMVESGLKTYNVFILSSQLVNKTLYGSHIKTSQKTLWKTSLSKAIYFPRSMKLYCFGESSRPPSSASISRADLWLFKYIFCSLHVSGDGNFRCTTATYVHYWEGIKQVTTNLRESIPYLDY